MKIAVIGAGISGLTAAYILSRRHQITLLEGNDYIGGHTHTHRIEDLDGKPLHIDSGFIVFNERTYPNFIALLEQLGVASQPSEMSFSVSCPGRGLEYHGSAGGLFVQRKNLLSPGHWRMVADIVRFYRQGKSILASPNGNGMPRGRLTTVGEFLQANRYSGRFVRDHLIPVSSAIWSAQPEHIEDFPIKFMLRFFDNHGMLNLSNRPQWRVVKGGSQRYVDEIIKPFREGIRLGSPVSEVRRFHDRVEVKTPGQDWERFDQVVIAAHSDQALRMLGDADRAEREILGAIEYQSNATVLHSDESLLPRDRRAWASWNYHLTEQRSRPAAVTYHMNRLQSLKAKREYSVTLNRCQEIDPGKVLRRMDYQHPIFTPLTRQAQERRAQLKGRRRTHFCGAYWGYGFHEDGVKSALRVCRNFGMELTP